MRYSASATRKGFPDARIPFRIILRAMFVFGMVFILTGCLNSSDPNQNDDPTITGLPSQFTVLQPDTNVNINLSVATFNDTDSAVNAITLTLLVDSGTLDAASTANVAVSGTGTDTLILTGTAADIDTYLNTTSNILYTVGGVSGFHAVVLSLTANDGGFTGNGGGSDVALGNLYINIDGTNNDAPFVENLNGDSLNYNKGAGAVIIDQGGVVTVSDYDSTDFNGGNLTLTITSGEDAAEDILSLDSSGVIAFAGTTAGSNVSVSGSIIGTLGNNIAAGNDLVINFNLNADRSRVSSLIQAMTYQNTDNSAPTVGVRTLRLTITDGDGGTSSNNDVTVTVT